MSQPEDLDDPIQRLISMWRAGVGHYTAETEPGTPALEHARELGQYTGEALYALAATGAELASGMDARKRSHLAHGITLEWFTKIRTFPDQQTLAALAFAADMLHAALDGVRGSGRIDVDETHELAVKLRDCLDDAHELAVKLQDFLDACSGSNDIVAGLQQMLAEAAGEAAGGDD